MTIAMHLRAEHDDRVRRRAHRLSLATSNERVQGRDNCRAGGDNCEYAAAPLQCIERNSVAIHSC